MAQKTTNSDLHEELANLLQKYANHDGLLVTSIQVTWEDRSTIHERAHQMHTLQIESQSRWD